MSAGDTKRQVEIIREYEQKEEQEDTEKAAKTTAACEFAEPTQVQTSEESVDLALLPMDHPLMQKFQRLVKEYLLRAKTQVSEQLADIKYAIKEKQKLREDAGIKLYDMQENLKQQNVQIQEYEQQLQEQMKLREAEECLITNLEDEYKSKEQQAKEMQQQYKKRMRELEQINELEGNTHDWVEDLENSLKNAKRMVHRDAQMQQQLNEEKRRSDLLFLRLDMEVKKCEKELTDLKEEITDMQDVKEVLSQSLANANADLTVLQNEHKRLNQAWGEVIVAISHRDKIMHELQQCIDKEEEHIKNCNFSIYAAKKLIKKENLQYDKLLQFKARIAADFNLLKGECVKHETVMKQLEEKLEEMPLFLNATLKELQEAKNEGTVIENELHRILWRMDKYNKSKYELEEDILKTMQDQLIADKASKYRLKILQTTQEHRRNMELNLTSAQNQLANALVQIEIWKGNITRLNHESEKQQAEYAKLDAKFQQEAGELKTLETQIDIKLKRIDKLNKIVDEIRSKGEDEFAGSPTERKVKQLEKILQTAEQQIREHQQFWLMMQNHFVNLSQKRNTQLTEIQVTTKQLSILKQKALKTDIELHKAETEMRGLARETLVSTTKVELLNKQMYDKQQQLSVEEEECLRQHNSLIQNLRDKEMEVLQIEEKINELKDNIEQLKDMVLDKHREALSWETQYKMVEETLEWRKQQRAKNNELNIMKTEIHRMQIRHQQLKRAQEKLMQDLEHTIMHREAIFNTSTRRAHKESKLNQTKAPTSLQTQVTDMRNKIKQTESEIQQLSGPQLEKLNSEYECIQSDIAVLREQLEAVKAEQQEICAQIDEAVLQKHINIELIVREQNRVKAYQKLAQSATPPRIQYTDSSLDLQKQKAIEYNDNLQEVVQSLLNDFPDRAAFLKKMHHLLKL